MNLPQSLDTPSNLDATLRDHAALCEKIYHLILCENGELRKTGQQPEHSILEKKQELLSLLDTSLNQLRRLAAERRSEIPKCKAAIEKAQQVILKTLLLNRENEQLLLKTTMFGKPVLAPPRPSPSHLQKLYQRHNYC